MGSATQPLQVGCAKGNPNDKLLMCPMWAGWWSLVCLQIGIASLAMLLLLLLADTAGCRLMYMAGTATG